MGVDLLSVRRAVFVDRDGTINRAIVRGGKAYPPDSAAELELIPGAAEALSSLRAAGFRVIVVTNQPDVGAGRQRLAEVVAIHQKLESLVPVDDIRVCIHTDADRCACRKPRPGMILDAAARWSIDLRRSWMVGDRWRDVEAGRAAGCRTIWLRTCYDERAPEAPDACADSLLEASALILGERAVDVEGTSP